MIRELVSTFDRTVGYMRGLVEDLGDEEMSLQPHGAPNHAAWTLGHVVHSCQAMAGELGVPPWLPEDWESRYGYGSSPAAAGAAGSPTREALLASLADGAGRLRTALLSIDEGRLAEALPDADARAVFPTLGDALLQVVAAHTAFHAGQLAAWRRAIGRRPAGVFL